MGEHTPGPWVVTRLGVDAVSIFPADRSANNGCAIAQFFGPDKKANAQLAAAAPDLLKAAQMQEAAELSRPMDCEECGGEGEPEACGSCFPPFDDARIARRAAIAKASPSPTREDGK